MPKTVLTLITHYTATLTAEALQNLRTHRMILRHHCKQIGSCHENPTVGTTPMSNTVLVRIRMIAMIENPFFRTPQIFVIFDYLIGSIIDITHVTGHLSHTCKERDSHESIISPDGIFMRPDTGNSTVSQTRLAIVQVLGCFINIIQERIIRMLHLQVNQAGSHRAVIIQTLSTEYHVPTQFTNAIPSFIFHCLIILFLKEVKITLVKYEIHIFKNIIIILLRSRFIGQFH